MEMAGKVALALFEGRSRVQREPYGMFARGWKATIGYAREQLRGMLRRIVERLAGE